MGILRDIARAIKPDAARPNGPKTAEDARERLHGLLESMRRDAPRAGLGAATGHFVDHVAGVARRYGARIFTCFDDPRIPSTTNGLEGFFGVSKAHLRHALGTGSTSGGVAQNLGADYLAALTFARSQPASRILDKLAAAPPSACDAARRSIADAERTATLRRSRRRTPRRHLDHLLQRWSGTT